MNGVCELMTSQLVGTLSDKHGRRPVQIAAQLGQVACLLLLALALRQVVDYGVAALCLPSLGFMRQLDKELAVSLLAFSRGTAGLLGNYKVSLQSYTADISGAEECPERMAYLGAAMVVGLCSGLKHSLIVCAIRAGSMVVFVVEKMQLSFRVSFFAATCFNALIMLLAP